MASKPDKEKKPSGKTTTASGKDSEKNISSRPKKQMEEEDELEDTDEIETTPISKKGGKASPVSKKGKVDDDDEAADDVVDDWDKVEEEEEWDPDFEEFDLPKSKGKKAGGGAAGKKGIDEEDFKIDDEFKDLGLFNDSNFDEEEDDF